MGRKADLQWLDIVSQTQQNSVAQFRAIRQIFPQNSAIVAAQLGEPFHHIANVANRR